MLLFLGAFLVIAASAIFAVTVWDIASPLAKLAFMGTLTIGFYVAGYFARTKLHLKAGSGALTVVGSALLLFDSWIVISGFSFEGPLPWAVALLFVSAVYWLTEVRLGDRFYGLAGAAAQVGWWWLMAAGLQLDVPVRLAGIAVVALVWQLVAERASRDGAWSSLAGMLLWAAPVVELLAALGIAYNALAVGESTWTLLGSAAVAAASGGVVAWRSGLIPRGREWVAGAAQVPLFIVLLLPSDASWLGVALLALATIGYALLALLGGGAPLTIAALGTEFLAFGSVGSLLKLQDQTMAPLFAALALSWVFAAWLAEKGELEREPRFVGTGGYIVAARVGGFVLLLGASALSLISGAGVPLTGPRIPASDVVAAAVILVCWAAAAMLRKGPLFASATVVWSFVALASVVGWAAPDAHSTGYALALLVVAAAWLAARGAMQLHYRINSTLFGWLMRGTALLIVLGGLLAETYFHTTVTSVHGALLVLGGAVVFAGDTTLGGPPVSASIAAFLAVISAYLAGAGGSPQQGVVAAAAAGTVVAVAGAAMRAVARTTAAPWLAIAAAATATGACAAGTLGDRELALALALATASWVAAGFAAREPRLSLPAGLTAFASATALVAAFNPVGWVTVLVLGACGIALGAVMLAPGSGRGGSHSGLGAGFSLAGLAGLSFLALLGATGPMWAEAEFQRWSALGEQGLVVALLILGAYVVVQATYWRIEPGLYLGYGVLLLAAFAEIGAQNLVAAEWYSTALAAYLIAMGYLYASRERSRSVPFAVDLAAVVIALGVPVWMTVQHGFGAESFVHTAWAVLLSLAFVSAGIVLKVRAYLFGGAVALVVVTGYRTITYLAAFWWLVLGLIGMVMLVIALTWERQRVLLSETQRRLKDSFENWR